jgi:hypothetical protein
MFITTSKIACHLSSFWARWIRQIRCKAFCPRPRRSVPFRNTLRFRGEARSALRPTSEMEDHPLSVVRDGLFIIFPDTFHIWRLSFPTASWERAVPWWQRPNFNVLIFVCCLLFVAFYFRGKEFIPGLVPQCTECTRHCICVNNAFWALESAQS